MKYMIWIILFSVSNLVLAQNKTILTVNGEKITHDIHMTSAERDTKYPLPAGAPNVGLQIFNTTTKCHEFYDGTGWYNYCWKGRINPATGGTSVVNGYTCNTASAGVLEKGVGVVATTITQTITADVQADGTYDITATANGVTFSKSGSFGGTGLKQIVLEAQGNPINAGIFDFTLNTSKTCTFDRVVIGNLGDGTVITGTRRIWQEKNIGATRAGQSITDYQAYGSLYQWGRPSDGHEKIDWTAFNRGTVRSGTTITLSGTDSPIDSLFVITNAAPNDWRSTKNDNLWKGVSGINNPCPSGFRVPTITEWSAEISTAGITNGATAYASVLKLMMQGFRLQTNGVLSNLGSYGGYWASTPTAVNAPCIAFHNGSIGTGAYERTKGFAVRCIKD